MDHENPAHNARLDRFLARLSKAVQRALEWSSDTIRAPLSTSMHLGMRLQQATGEITAALAIQSPIESLLQKMEFGN